MGIFQSIFYRLNKKSIDKALLKFKKIPIDIVYNIIEKSCWRYGIKCEVILKTKTELELKLTGKKEITLLKFHKAFVVFKEDYEKMLSLGEIIFAKKIVYITTGVFHGEVYKENMWRISRCKVILDDNYNFIKRQVWLKKDFRDHLKYKKLDFSRYLPL
ncbi:hypothetical protein [Clostridium fallax]|uniref:Uncharacterized protein n=1 Tax=Clostridium fallax TaxID=1533 RepID=A0A1M4YWS8_9CLOT|nr:hypothetical protein [Clostridium fallax]SHF10180.1 hypothetical protein SAMN05443638_13329 [Clostridium fallax]SQB22271.1 Uncharacterised protein [Clostridium fallax]